LAVRRALVALVSRSPIAAYGTTEKAAEWVSVSPRDFRQPPGDVPALRVGCRQL
jgi:hypothetical protein